MSAAQGATIQDARLGPPDPVPRAGPTAGWSDTSLSRNDRIAQWAIVGSLVLLVTVRFFTEDVPLLPRAANLVDVPILLLLVLMALLTYRPSETRDTYSRWLPVLALAFLFLSAVAVLTNPSRTELGPALLFVYGFLGPIALYMAVRHLWPGGRTATVSRLIVMLGLLQLAKVAFIDLRVYQDTSNPDDFSGTFGENPYQLVFFLLLFMAVLAGVSTFEPRRAVARFVPVLIVASLATIVLAQYRALLATTGLALLLVAVLISLVRGRAVVTAAISLIAFTGAVALGAQHLKLSETTSEGVGSLIDKRLNVADQVLNLYADQPRFVLTGTGPGTYSSRAWATFAKADSSSEANVVGPYVLALTGGVYTTDVSDRYVRPLLDKAFAGSYAPSAPFSSYTAVAAEIGLPGFLILLAIYLGAFLGSISRALRSIREAVPNDPLPGILLASTTALFVLIQMGLLQNWLETARITFITWTLLAIATKEYDLRHRDAASSHG